MADDSHARIRRFECVSVLPLVSIGLWLSNRTIMPILNDMAFLCRQICDASYAGAYATYIYYNTFPFEGATKRATSFLSLHKEQTFHFLNVLIKNKKNEKSCKNFQKTTKNYLTNL